MIYIIKKDGTRELYDASKIVRAVNKFSQEEIDLICK